jgi:hypothetical protein
MVARRVIKATWAKHGAGAGYSEAARGGDRVLSDEIWQGRVTAKEIRSYLEATYGSRAAGDKDAKEIRRAAKKLGIRLAEDQRGRKWKPPLLPKEQEPKRQRGRPRTKAELEFVKDLEAIEADLVKAPRVAKMDSWVDSLTGKATQKVIAQIDQMTVAEARKIIREMDREIARLTLRRGGRRGLFVY